MKKLCLTLTAIVCLVLSASAAKIYINPGHGAWHANCRNMLLVNIPRYNDTLGFYESNTNLWKGLFLEKKLLEKGYQVKMSRKYSGGTNELESSPYDKALHVIGAESQAYGSDYFISIHSNAHVDGNTTNYPVFIHKGYDNSESNSGSIWGERILWDHHFKIFSSGMEPNNYYSATNKCIRGGLSMNGWDYGVLRTQYRPGTLVEGYFHTYQPARHRAMQPDWCRQEGLRYFRGFTQMYGTAKDTKGYIMGYVRARDKQINQTNYSGRAGDDIHYPLNGAKIVLRDANGKIVKTDNHRYVARDAVNQNKDIYTTDNYYNGVFVYDDLAPGTYSISVHCSGYQDYKANLTVTAHETTYTEIFMVAGSGTQPDTNQAMGTTGLNPYAYDLSSTWNESTQQLTVKFSLNADAYVDGAGGYADGIQIFVTDDPASPKKHYVYGVGKNDCYKGQNKSFTIDLSGGIDKNGKPLPLGKNLYATVAVQGDRSNTAPREDFNYHKIYCGHGIAVDKNPNSKNFGKIFVTEARQEEARGGELSGYFTKGLAGMYVIDPDFAQRSSTRYTGGNDFSLLVIENTYDGLARKGYQPWRVRVSEEGRIFVCSNDMHQRQATNAAGERDGIAVWEVDRNNFNNWTPILHGYRRFVSGQTGTNYTFAYKDVNGVEQFIGPICGMDVKGTGDDVTLLLYTVNQAGVWLDMKGFRAYEYNVKSGALKPVSAFNNGGYGYVFEYTTLRYGVDGSYWFGGNRSEGSDGDNTNGKAKEPNLGHVKLDGTSADYTNYNAEFYGGAGLINYKSTYNNTTINGANHSWLISGKDNGGASDGYFDVFLVTSAADGGVGVTRMDGNGGRPNWQKITASGMGRNLNDMAIDYAENLYIVSSSGEMIRAFAMPYCGEKITVARQEFAFRLPVKDMTWHPYPAGYTITNQDLKEQFEQAAEGQDLANLMTNANSTWKWLGDHILATDASVATNGTWSAALADFFAAKGAFATTGQPAQWEKKWWEATFPGQPANGFKMPTIARKGWILENWRYGNHIGYYYFKEESYVKDNQYNEAHKDSIHIWARWIEKCLYEDYMPYIQSGDTSAIDLKEYAISANLDLLSLTEGKTTDMGIHRILSKTAYNSICLPFEISNEEIKRFTDAAGNYVFDPQKGGKAPRVYVYDHSDVVTVGESKELQLTFHELTHEEKIGAGVPFLIRPAEDIVDKLYIESVSITAQGTIAAEGDVNFIGTWDPENLNISEEYQTYLFSSQTNAENPYLEKVTGATKALALSGYFKVPASMTCDYAVVKLQSDIHWHPYPIGYTITNDDLWDQFVEDTVGQTLADMLTTEQSNWKWLGDYIQAVTATVAEQVVWETAVSDFFNAENDFATAGQPANWESLWQSATFSDTLANGAAMPKVKRHGWALEDWRYGNEDGYYYFSEASKVVNNQYDQQKAADSTHIWARWVEKCLYEDYETYIESGDTSAIDIRTWTLTANEDLLVLTEGTTTEFAIKRMMYKDEYTSLCLPFALTKEVLAQMSDAEGNYVFDAQNGGATPTIYIYDQHSTVVVDGNIELQLSFHIMKDDEEIKAGVPFLIKPTEDITDKLYIESTYITKGEPIENIEGEIEFVSMWQPKTVNVSEEYDVLLVTGASQLTRMTESTKILGASGYFKVPVGVAAYDYAVINVTGSEATPTWVENITGTIKKIIRNCRMYILRGENVYSITGQKQ